MNRTLMIILATLCVAVCAEEAPEATPQASGNAASPEAPAPVAAGETPALAPGFQLEDQYHAAHRHTFPADRPAIVLIGDRHVTNHIAAWYNPIAERYIGPEAKESGAYRDKEELYIPPEHEVGIVAVAALKDMPVVWKPLVRWVLRRYVRRSVLMDWGDTVAHAYAFVPQVVNVYVIAPDGEVLLHAHGRNPKDALDRIFNAIDTSIAANREMKTKAIQEAS